MFTMPHITAEGDSRAAVLQEIRQKLAGALAQTEVVTVSLSSNETPPFPDETPAEKRLREKGFRHYGIFANDPGAMEVFDEIERQRAQFTIGHLKGETVDEAVAVLPSNEDELIPQEAAA